MRYRYRCNRCNERSERNVPVDQRDSQQCECGHALTRLFEPTIAIHIPDGFGATFDPVTPTDSTQAATWHTEQVRPVGSRMI